VHQWIKIHAIAVVPTTMVVLPKVHH